MNHFLSRRRANSARLFLTMNHSALCLFIGVATENNSAVKPRGTGDQLKQCPGSERVVSLTAQLDFVQFCRDLQ